MLTDIAARRMRKEMTLLKNSPREGVQLSLAEEDRLDQFSGAILGPVNTPYHGGVFQVKINIPVDFPFSPPEIRFQTKIFHPNVDPSGNICLDILKVRRQTSPGCNVCPSEVLGADGLHHSLSVLSWTVSGWFILYSFQSCNRVFIRTLLSEPNASDPLMPEIADLYINNQTKVKRMFSLICLLNLFSVPEDSQGVDHCSRHSGWFPPPSG